MSKGKIRKTIDSIVSSILIAGSLAVIFSSSSLKNSAGVRSPKEL